MLNITIRKVILVILSWFSINVVACEKINEARMKEIVNAYKQRNVDVDTNISDLINSHAIDLYFETPVKYKDGINDLFLIAAILGNRNAQYNLGRKRIEGDGIEKDIELGECWMKKSADQNSPSANFYLGNMYIEKGSKKEIVIGNEFLIKGTELKHSPSFCSYGISLAKGLGVEKNIDEAIKYFDLSVMYGNQKCATNLIKLYSEGLKVTKNICKAKFYTNYPFVASVIGKKELEEIEAAKDCNINCSSTGVCTYQELK